MELIKYNAAKKALTEAKNVDEVKHIYDKSVAIQAYAKQANDKTLETDAWEIRIRAERRLGEMLKEQKETVGLNRGAAAGGVKEGSRGAYTEPRDDTPTLSDAGISKKLSSQAQAYADVPEDAFEEILSEGREKIEQENVRVSNKLFIRGWEERQRNQRREEMAVVGANVQEQERWNVFHADIRTWQAPRKYDWIITDPPYPKEFLPLWSELARRSTEWLKDGGLLVAMSGQSYLDDISRMLGEHLDYYWTAAYLTPGQPTPLRQINVNTTWKPLLIYSKGKYTGKIFGDVFKSDGNDKESHKWGQSISGMRDIVSKLCLAGEHVLDPFCGAGTTGIAAIEHGCFFHGVDIDEQNVNISKGRLNDT